MNVLVTGATGFLGGRVAEELLRAGHVLRLLVRRPSAALLPEGAAVAHGDVTDPDSLKAALAGCDAVVHLAAVVRRWARDRRLFDRVNVEGTARVIDLALAGKVSRIVYCSSFMALGPTDGTIGDEDTRHDGCPRNDYERTKWLADRLARDRQAQGAPLVVVYPGVVYGPGRLTDGNILAGAARDLLRGRFPGTVGPGDRRQCLAYVDDVARGVRRALESAAPGSRYVLGGENVTVNEAIALIARAGGVPVPRRAIPYGVATALGRALRWQAGLTGWSPPLTDEEVEIYRHDWAYASDRAMRDLGYTITPAAEGLGRTVRWLFDVGLVRSRA